MTTRLLRAIRNDITVQFRNKLYYIGIGVAVLVGGILSQLVNGESLAVAFPTIMLLVVGGSTLLYVAGMILFEKDEGTLSALIVSPLRTTEYLGSKIITLTGLATLEALVLLGVTMLIISGGGDLIIPNVPLLLVGIIALGVLYTLLGIVLIVRYDSITDFLMPVIVIVLVLQIPLLYFLGMVPNALFLLIPTSAPTMLITGAYESLSAAEWLYATGYTSAILIGLGIWAYRAFNTHIVMKVG